MTKQDQREFAKTVIGIADSYKDYVLKQLRRAWERADLIERRAAILKVELADIGEALKSGAIDPDTARHDLEAAGLLPIVEGEQ